MKNPLRDPVTRRAALVATAFTLPILVIALVLLSTDPNGGTSTSSTPSKPLPAISVAAPPANPAADAPCTALLADLPTAIVTTTGTLSGRPADSTWTYVAAWGDPPVVLRCGVPRPAGLTVNSAAFVIAIDGVNFFQSRSGDATVFTAIDRAVYIEVSAPRSYAQPPIAPVAAAIAKALPQVCVAPQAGQSAPDPSKLCTHRS